MIDLVEDLAWRTSAARFARRCSVLGHAPDPQQQEILDCNEDAMLLCTRQFGKSSVTAAKGAHHGATRREALVLVTSPGERQSTELLLKIKRTLRETGVAEIKRDTATTLELTNGSRYFALPGQEHTIRGFSAVTLLIVDEAARVPVSLYEAVGPMMAVSKGQTMLLSSAWFKTGFFWEQWGQEGDRWRKFRVTALECRRIDRAWLERERLTTYAGRPRAFDREFMCEFQDPDDVAFNMDFVNRAIGKYTGPVIGQGPVKYDDKIDILLGGA